MTTSQTDTSRRVLEVLRFAVPWDASVAVVGREVEDIGRRVVTPLARDGETDLSADAAIARLEALRADGCEYLVVGASGLDWLDARPGFTAHLDTDYRLVDRDDDACAVYAVHGAGGRTGADGLPLPPVDMIRITQGLYRRAANPDLLYQRFENTGAETAGWIRDILTRNGAAIEGMGAVMDFGCGCGRVTRYLKDLPGSVHGSDYNPHLVHWCAGHLAFGEFRTNDAEPPLPYDDDSFDFLYSISIFTHLDEPLQVPWMRELARVVRPGGLLLITVMGEDRLRSIPAWEHLREPFEAGELVVTKPERAGSNACAVYHPQEYVRETLAGSLEIVDYEAGSPAAVRQDGILLRTPVS
jgi:SAM-dependent methyltransferase